MTTTTTATTTTNQQAEEQDDAPLNLLCDYTLADSHHESRRLSHHHHQNYEQINEHKMMENKQRNMTAIEEAAAIGSNVHVDVNMNHFGGGIVHQYESNNDLGEVNKYYNLGLSLSSQELIGDYYHALVNQDANRAKSFEEILYSIIEDIQAYKKDVSRLEQSLKNEKEHNKEILKQMIEEADHQLSESSEKIRNEEKENYEKSIAKLREQFQTETGILHDNLSKLKAWQEKHLEEKNVESQQLNEILDELKALKDENKNLKSQLRESTTEISILRSNLAELKQEKDDKQKDMTQKNLLMESHREIRDLKDEIKALHEANQKLNDANDLLRKEIDANKFRLLKTIDNTDDSDTQSASSEASPSSSSNNPALLKSNKSIELTNQSLSRPSIIINSSIHSKNDTDEDVDVNLDSGFYPSTNSPFCLINQQQQPPLTNSSKRESLCGSEANNLSHLSEISLLNDANELKGYMENSVGDLNNRSSQTVILSNASTSSANAAASKKKYLINRNLTRLNHHRTSSSSAAAVYHKKKDRIELINGGVKTPERLFKIVFAGDAAVGKTSFIMRYCKNQFLTTLSSTLGVDFHMKMLNIDGKSIALQLWDTCGQERFRSIAKSYFRKADGIVLMYDCTYERSFLNIREWILIIIENNESIGNIGGDESKRRIPIIIVGNKTDLREACRQANKTVIEYEQGLKLAKEYGALFVETSAKTGTNMEESLIELSRSMSCTQDFELKTDHIQLGLNQSMTMNASFSSRRTCC